MVMEETGQAKVENLDNSAAVEQDVARLNITVDQACLVKVL